MRVFLFGIVFLLALAAKNSHACSAFTLISNQRVVMAKSYDWDIGIGVVLSNSQGKRQAIPTGYAPPMNWNAQYGSITFNQYGRFMPNGGMNEAGLAIEVLWLDDTRYPEPVTDRVLNELQWVQYHLDCFATVDEVVRSNEEITIVPIFAKLHYYVADRHGNSAVIEFINGNRVVHYGDNLICKAITNDTYDHSLAYQTAPLEAKSKGYNSSFNRFTRLYGELQGNPKQQDEGLVDKAFSLLESVWSRGWTKWNIVYDLTNLKVYYKSNIISARKEFLLSSFNFSEGSNSLFVDISTFLAGEVSDKFIPFEEVTNFELLSNSARLTGIELPGNMVELMAVHPSKIEEMTMAMGKFYSSVGNIVINVTGLKTNYGSVSIGLFNSEEGFNKQRPQGGGRVRITNGIAQVVIYNVPLGKDYAIGYYHDANSNERLDVNIIKIPKERYGFSGSGKRSFEKAKFSLNQKELLLTL
jgi:choloylglycine hydrolase